MPWSITLAGRSHSFIPCEDDEVTRLIVDRYDARAFQPLSSMSVGKFRDWLLDYETAHIRARMGTPRTNTTE